MLLLERKHQQSITINENIIVKILNIGIGKVRIGIVAPRDVPIFRTELLEKSSCLHCKHAGNN